MKTITNITCPAFALFAIALGSLALSPQMQAVCQEGCLTSNNTVLGDNALIGNTTGANNTATGQAALQDNTTGSANTATGEDALTRNTTGEANTASGAGALFENTDGTNNTAIGFSSLFRNTTGDDNTASGVNALSNNTTGNNNTAAGHNALSANTTGSSNTATGINALLSNTTGSDNTAIGDSALRSNAAGNWNTAVGDAALRNNTGGLNTAIGHIALLNNSGNSNIAVGANAGSALTTGNNNIDIGNAGGAAEASTIRIGTTNTHTNTYIAGIYGAALGSGSTVRVDSAGHLGTVASSARFKKEIKPMDKVSEVILALQPVTFRFREEIDANGIRQFGLIAEEVEKVDPDLVERDQQNKPYTVRYEAVNAMLLNEFLKEHKTVEELKKEIAALTAIVKEQAAQIQSVSAQFAKRQVGVAAGTGLEMSKFATGRINSGEPRQQALANNERK